MRDYANELGFADLEDQYGLPPGLLSAVMDAESAGNPDAVSPVGAQGLFQFMPETAEQYGIDPYDPAQAAQGAARMYGDLSKKYQGDIPKMLAGYNWGQGNVDKHGLEKAPKETQDYIAKIQGRLTGGSTQETAIGGGGSAPWEMDWAADDVKASEQNPWEMDWAEAPKDPLQQAKKLGMAATDYSIGDALKSGYQQLGDASGTVSRSLMAGILGGPYDLAAMPFKALGVPGIPNASEEIKAAYDKATGGAYKERSEMEKFITTPVEFMGGGMGMSALSKPVTALGEALPKVGPYAQSAGQMIMQKILSALGHETKADVAADIGAGLGAQAVDTTFSKSKALSEIPGVRTAADLAIPLLTGGMAAGAAGRTDIPNQTPVPDWAKNADPELLRRSGRRMLETATTLDPNARIEEGEKVLAAVPGMRGTTGNLSQDFGLNALERELSAKTPLGNAIKQKNAYNETAAAQQVSGVNPKTDPTQLKGYAEQQAAEGLAKRQGAEEAARIEQVEAEQALQSTKKGLDTGLDKETRSENVLDNALKVLRGDGGKGKAWGGVVGEKNKKYDALTGDVNPDSLFDTLRNLENSANWKYEEEVLNALPSVRSLRQKAEEFANWKPSEGLPEDIQKTVDQIKGSVSSAVKESDVDALVNSYLKQVQPQIDAYRAKNSTEPPRVTAEDVAELNAYLSHEIQNRNLHPNSIKVLKPLKEATSKLLDSVPGGQEAKQFYMEEVLPRFGRPDERITQGEKLRQAAEERKLPKGSTYAKDFFKSKESMQDWRAIHRDDPMATKELENYAMEDLGAHVAAGKDPEAWLRAREPALRDAPGGMGDKLKQVVNDIKNGSQRVSDAELRLRDVQKQNKAAERDFNATYLGKVAKTDNPYALVKQASKSPEAMRKLRQQAGTDKTGKATKALEQIFFDNLEESIARSGRKEALKRLFDNKEATIAARIGMGEKNFKQMEKLYKALQVLDPDILADGPRRAVYDKETTALGKDILSNLAKQYISHKGGVKGYAMRATKKTWDAIRGDIKAQDMEEMSNIIQEGLLDPAKGKYLLNLGWEKEPNVSTFRSRFREALTSGAAARSASAAIDREYDTPVFHGLANGIPPSAYPKLQSIQP